MTDCSSIPDDLKAYADGELSRLRRRAVRRHLMHCASCRAEILHMTQIAEELRTADAEAALSPTLRQKILEDGPPTLTSPTPTRQNWGGGASSHKRPILAWGLAGVAVVGWFLLFPMFHGSTLKAGYAPTPITQMRAPLPQHPTKSFGAAALPSKPVKMTVRLSDREAGIDDYGKFSGQIKDPNFKAQTFNAFNPPASFDALRQVHKEASIGVQVANPEATGDTVADMVKETGGYVAANNLSTGDDGLKTAELIVKVPVAQFETFLAQVSKLGSVQSKNINGEDITEKTSDANQTEAVLEEDVQQSEARLKSLGSKAKWHDEQATRDLRIQLAQARARLVLLKRMAALGTITVDLSQTPKAAAPPPVTGGFLNTLKENTHDALQSLVGSAGALLALMIWLLAYAPVWIPLLLIGRYSLKEYRKREAQA